MLVKLSKDPLKLFDDIWENAQLPAAPAFKVDITEDSHAFHIDAELPGLRKEQITLAVEDDVLTIKAENKRETEEKEKNYHRVERSYGSYSRSFNLGEMIDQEHIEAAYDNGILHVTLPKAQEVKKTKEITIS
ncbi:Hsp20/alpha crystallin family protein [Prosthecochloris sp. HL-130-GSB]|uniref:Hsp20/alpha crystallin family protein n=1 Tax=Prosthecochloris aestuarii TaxID=1102 RepID=A0A831SQF3_PROAE|nr:Hsp20/alpha crystallin family protein [Prosthecochloris sp. HL-130-GSB]ARM31960.1 heat-shock protein Hsp20 [Prosthecochloris sp. HL-130-GSB]MBO8092533.1 Hsp20/alpha crystallin family protein [Prosthecochloris sp.]HED31761.1 Hsp20/alpha crystallin family protein [Prosthecochloris aestuarii]